MPSSVTPLDCAASTWADQDRPTKTFTGNHQVGVRDSAGSPSAFTYLRFGLPGVLRDPEVTVLAATLNLFTSTSWAATPTVDVRRIETGYPQFDRLNWNNRPGVIGATASLTQASSAVGHLWAIDVTTIMQAAATVEKFYGLRVAKTGTALRHFYSSYGPREYRPTLEVTYTRKPAAPVDLSPAGNRRVSIGRPVVRAFDGHPEDSSGYLESINVQQNATNVWTSPTFDSGTVPAVVPELDLATTAAAVLADGASIWWRVRVKTDAQQWSLWSDGAQYRREDKGTLAVTNPAAPSAVQQWVRNPRAVTDTADWTAAAQTLTRVTTGGYLGDTHFRMTATATTNRFLTQTATVPATVGQQWTMSAYLKSSNWTSARFDAVLTGASNMTGATKTITSTWTRHSETVTLPAGTTAMALRVNMTNGAIGDILDVDGLMLEKVATLGPYRDGTSVAWAWSGTANNSTSGPIYVTEWTPPITWTLTGATQAAYRVVISRLDSTTGALVREVHDSGKVKSTETSYTVPREVLVDDRTYRADVYAWDSEDREATPGDPAYVTIRRPFTFAEDTTVTPVSSFTVTQHATMPDAVLGWSRSTTPDSYTILRKGPAADDVYEVVEEGVTDLLVSGTTYAYRDRAAPGHRQLTYKPQAIVNGKASANNPTATITIEIFGIWLRDLDREIDVFISGVDGLQSFVQTETSAVYLPPRGSPVIATQGQRGYEGTVTGFLHRVDAVTPADWERRLERIREQPDALLRLVFAEQTLRGHVRAITTSIVGDDPIDHRRAVSFEFYEKVR